MLFEMTLIFNIVTVSVFWSMLLEEALRDCGGVYLKEVNTYTSHSLPGLSALVAFLITDVTMRASHYKPLIPITLIYGYINYNETKINGKPLYWFLNWEDETSIYILIGLILLFILVWFAVSALTLILKPRPV